MASVLGSSSMRLGMRPSLTRSNVRVPGAFSELRLAGLNGARGSALPTPRMRQVGCPGFQRRSAVVRAATEVYTEHDFDLPTAVSMAAYSFHSYLDPIGADGFSDISPNGVVSTFTDPEFIEEQFTAILYFDLISATSLSIADFGGTSDPYAVIQVGPSTATSKVIDTNLNPVWNEKYFFYLKNPASDILKIDVYDKDLITEDDELGYLVLPLAQLADGKPHELDLKLLGANALKGRIQIRITVVPLDTMPTEMIEAMAATKVGPSGTAVRSQQRDMPRLVNVMLQQYVQHQGQVSGMILKDTISRQQAFQEEISSAYNNPNVPDEIRDEWKTLSEMVGKTKWGYGVPVLFCEQADTDTQVWMYRNKESKDLVISFRGTETNKWKDLVADKNALSVSLDDGAGPTQIPLPIVGTYLTQLLTDRKKVNVHQGFYKNFTSVENQVLHWVDCIAGNGENGSWNIMVTGHSLGGALAQLMAHKLATRPGKAQGLHNITCYTFGSPRVGNEAFVAEMDEVVPNNWRVLFDEDVAPFHPRIPGLTHTNKHVVLDMKGNLKKELGGEDLSEEAAAIFEELALGPNGTLEKHIEPAYVDVIQQVVLNKAEELAEAAAELAGEIDARTPEERIAALEYI